MVTVVMRDALQDGNRKTAMGSYKVYMERGREGLSFLSTYCNRHLSWFHFLVAVSKAAWAGHANISSRHLFPLSKKGEKRKQCLLDDYPLDVEKSTTENNQN